MQRWLHLFFLPHEDNDYHPHALQKVSIVTMIFMALCTFALANVQSMFWLSSDWLTSAVLPAVVVEETNDARAEDSLPQLTRNSVLDQAATLKAEHMATESYFAHFSPEGISPWYWFDSVDYDYLHAGENLAVHFSDSKDVVEAWLDSPTHRANIMNGTYEEIGIGVAKGRYEGQSTVFVVQLFGTKQPAPALLAEAAPVGAPTSEPVEEPTPAPTDDVLPVEPSTAGQSPAVAGTEVSSSSRQTEPEVEPAPVVSEAESSSTQTKEPSKTAVETLPASGETFIATTAPRDYSDRLLAQSESPSTWSKLLTQPEQVLQLMYLLMAAGVLGVLLVSIVVEVRRQRPLQLAYSGGLLAVLLCMWIVHQQLTATIFIV